MILLIECIAACMLFTIIMVGGVLWKRESFLHEYAPSVQQRFLDANPDYKPKNTEPNTGEKLSSGLIIAKILMCLFFIAVLTTLIYFAGAGSFATGALYTYTIWFVVNWYDVFALDIGIFAHWKKVRLPGTEDMDREYCSNAGKHIRDGFIGMAIGIPVSCICGLIIMVLK